MTEGLMQVLNSIRNETAENEIIAWKNEGGAAGYSEEAKIQKVKVDMMRKQIPIVERETKEFQSLAVMSRKYLENQKRTLEVLYQTVIAVRMYKKTVEKKARDYNKEVDRILNDYARYVEDVKLDLEEANSMYRIVKEKKIEMKKLQVELLMLQSNKKVNLKIREEKKRVQEMIYRTIIVNFAKAYHKRTIFEEKQKKNALADQEYMETMNKLFEATKAIRHRQSISYRQQGTFKAPDIKFSQNSQLAPSKSNESDAAHTSHNKEAVPAPPKALPFSQLGTLIANIKDDVAQENPPIKKATVDENAFFRKPFVRPEPSKIRILENKTVLPPILQKPKAVASKDERSKDIRAKLQKVVENLNRKNSFGKKFSHQTSTESLKMEPAMKKVKAANVASNDSTVTPEPNNSKQVTSPMPPNMEWLQEPHIELEDQEQCLYSQEEGEMRFSSQEPGTGTVAKPTYVQQNKNGNDNETIMKIKRRVSFATDVLGDDKKRPGSSTLKGKEEQTFAVPQTVNNAALKASESEYNQFSLSFLGKCTANAGNPFHALRKPDALPRTTAIKPPVNIMQQSQPQPNMDISLNESYDYEQNTDDFTMAGDPDASLMMSTQAGYGENDYNNNSDASWADVQCDTNEFNFKFIG